MATLTITIDTDNDAFAPPNTGAELSRILGSVRTQIEFYFSSLAGAPIILRDTNGNTCGRVTYAPDAPPAQTPQTETPARQWSRKRWYAAHRRDCVAGAFDILGVHVEPTPETHGATYSFMFGPYATQNQATEVAMYQSCGRAPHGPFTDRATWTQTPYATPAHNGVAQ